MSRVLCGDDFYLDLLLGGQMRGGEKVTRTVVTFMYNSSLIPTSDFAVSTSGCSFFTWATNIGNLMVATLPVTAIRMCVGFVVIFICTTTRGTMGVALGVGE